MTVNKYYIAQPIGVKQLNVTFEMDWYNEGQEDSIEIFQTNAAKEVVGVAKDFEVSRFAHEEYNPILNDNRTSINYEFNFFSGATNNLSASTSSDWDSNYLSIKNNGVSVFTPDNLFYNDNVFSKSFFKLDFYDLPDEKSQTNYLTIILPTQQGFTIPENIQNNPNATIRIPKFRLDYVGDKEGFYIYWLKKTNFISANTFYMSAKFFDASRGIFLKMMNTPQSTFGGGGSQYSFDGQIYFYYKVLLNYSATTYQVVDTTFGVRYGTISNPIKWYEYVNPK
jgi:hypothetical protein